MLVMTRSLTAVMAYEDASTAERAKEPWDHLMRTLRGHSWSWVALWEFALLRIPELRAAAVADAARADMILITTRGAGELPTEVKAWIEVWLAQKREMQDQQSTLAVLFDA